MSTNWDAWLSGVKFPVTLAVVLSAIALMGSSLVEAQVKESLPQHWTYGLEIESVSFIRDE